MINGRKQYDSYSGEKNDVRFQLQSIVNDAQCPRGEVAVIHQPKELALTSVLEFGKMRSITFDNIITTIIDPTSNNQKHQLVIL